MVLPNNGQFESREILHTGTTGIGTAGTSKRAETMPIAAKTSAAFAALFMPVDFHRPRLRYTHLSEWEESLQVRFRGEAAAPAMRVDNHSHIILAPIGDMVAAALFYFAFGLFGGPTTSVSSATFTFTYTSLSP